MNLDRKVFDNADVVAATGLTATAIQTWANRGILMLTEKQRNPGVGQKRLYSAADVARIAVTKSLIDRRFSTSGAGQVALRLERSPPTKDVWKKALEENARHIHLFVDGPDVVSLYIGDQPEELGKILMGLNEPGDGGVLGRPAERQQLRVVGFDIGPEVSAALAVVRASYRDRQYVLKCLPAGDGQAVLEARPKFTGGKCLRSTFASVDQLVNTLDQGLGLPRPQLTAIQDTLLSSQGTEIGGLSGCEFHVGEDTLVNLGMPED